MKKVILILMVVMFVAGMLVSCNNHVCPAYSSNDNTEQTEQNS